MSYDSDTIQELQDKREAERKKELERGVDPFLMRMCIIGGRYDEFKVFNTYIIYVYIIKGAEENTYFCCVVMKTKSKNVTAILISRY